MHPNNIWVATWSKDMDFQNICFDQDPGFDQPIPKGTMINIFPEWPSSPREQVLKNGGKSPCWIRIPCKKNPQNEANKMGFLDAMSKHFLLAQGNGNIEDYCPEIWEKSRVEYAGEIYVNLSGNEEFIINNGSGTFQPRDENETSGPNSAYDSNRTFLPWVATKFKKELGVCPGWVDKRKNREEPLEALPECDTEGGEKKKPVTMMCESIWQEKCE